jgi:hypothetical protein
MYALFEACAPKRRRHSSNVLGRLIRAAAGAVVVDLVDLLERASTPRGSRFAPPRTSRFFPPGFAALALAGILCAGTAGAHQVLRKHEPPAPGNHDPRAPRKRMRLRARMIAQEHANRSRWRLGTTDLY